MKNKKQIIMMIIIISILFIQSLSAAYAHTSLNSFIVFRDVVYMQNRSLLDTMRLYAAAKQDIENMYSVKEMHCPAEMYLALARCEYLMGITYKIENRNNEAITFFEQGVAWAEESLAISPTSEGYLLLGSGISFLCEVKSAAFGLKNHGKIEENARKALELNPDNLMAKHLIASFYIVTPRPLGNVQRGDALLRKILDQDYLSLANDDLFNLYLMLQVACVKQKKNHEAQMWREKGIALYPTNNFVNMLVK